MASCSVQVALRVRPLMAKETLQNCAECVAYVPGAPQVIIGADRSFTFDHVFAPERSQHDVFSCVLPLLDRFVDGYNATVLAYGQTGSGKTYSMGTGLDMANTGSANSNTDSELDVEIMGIVPRAVHDLYRLLRERYPLPSQARVFVSFIELYNEELIDLLNPATSTAGSGGNATGGSSAATERLRPNSATFRSDTSLRIREDESGNIVWVGVREEECKLPADIMGFLAKGSLCRTTGSTDMNMVSSRSHAIFSISIRIQKHIPIDTMMDTSVVSQPINTADTFEKLSAKFHFVDLAGSERLKRTNAEGTRAREGIAINSGLLALGNVISALGDETRIEKGVGHVPYRDSKLTRLLQDSLGGNSQTLMLACVSPADANFQETLNTLKYANRARNIKNRVVINQEISNNSVEVQQLRTQISRLKMELAAIKQQHGGIGMNSGSVSLSPSFENLSKVDEQHNTTLREKISELQTERAKLELYVTQLQSRIKDFEERLLLVQAERDTLLMSKHGYTLPQSVFNAESEMIDPKTMVTESQMTRMSTTEAAVNPIIVSYLTSITQLKAQLAEREMETKFLKQQAALVASLTASNILHSNYGAQRKPSALKQFKFALPMQENVPELGDIGQTLEKAREQVKQDMALLTTTSTREQTAYAWAKHKQIAGESSSSSVGDAHEDPAALHTLDVPTWSGTGRGVGDNGDENDEGVTADAVYKTLHKIQADIAIKEELIVRLEKTHTEYSAMKHIYEDKMKLLQENLGVVQKERDLALQRTEKNPKEKEKDVRARYEAKVRQLLAQISELRRKHTDASKTVTSSKTRNEHLITQMRLSIEALKGEKQRLLKSMRDDADRAREHTVVSEREIQRLRKREKTATEMAKKFERNYELQKLLLKRRSEEIVNSHSKLKSVMSLLKRSQTPKTISKISTGGVQSKRSSGSAHFSTVFGGNNNVGHVDLSAPSQIQMSFKKSLLDKEIEQVVAGQKTVQIMDELLRKRERLLGEKVELLAERDRVVLATAAENNTEPDHSAPQYMDDRLELIDAEVNYINARIKALQADVANGGSAQDSTPDSSAASQNNMDNILNVVRALSHEEAVVMLEIFLGDVTELMIKEKTQQINVDNLEKTTAELRRSLMRMRNAAMSSAVEYEKKIKTMQITDNMSDDATRFTTQSNTADPAYQKLLDVYGDGMFKANNLSRSEAPISRIPQKSASPTDGMRTRARKISAESVRLYNRSNDHDSNEEQMSTSARTSPQSGYAVNEAREKDRDRSLSASGGSHLQPFHSGNLRVIRRPTPTTENMDVFERLSRTYTVAAQAKVRDTHHRGDENGEQNDAGAHALPSSAHSQGLREATDINVISVLPLTGRNNSSQDSTLSDNDREQWNSISRGETNKADIVAMDVDDPKAYT